MDRRAFLRSTAIAAAGASLPWRTPFAQAQAPWRTFEVTTRVDLVLPQGGSRVWLPLPLAAPTEWHRDLGSAWKGNAARAEVLKEPKYGVTMLYAEWPASQAAPSLELTSRVATRDRDANLAAGEKELSAEERKFFTAPTELIPTDGIVRATASEIVRGKSADVDKARAIYEWVVENTFRDPKVRG